MLFEVAPLPYEKTALEPVMKAETLEFHYEKHHKGYMTNLQKLIGETEEASKSLEDVIKGSSGGVFNNAAQVWNHTFFWDGMKPGGGGEPADADIKALLEKSFGGFAQFREEFKKGGLGRFGSGYVWLVLEGDVAKVISTPNAETPLTDAKLKPLLTADVWEHAYYIDQRNRRDLFLEAFCDKLINWEHVAKQLKG